MRIHKYRAWDKDKNMFVSPYNKVIVGSQTSGHLKWELKGADEHKNIVFMQFTGLLDKNGKEIYESDIVIQNWDEPVAGRNKGVVVWNEKEAMFLIDYPNGGGSVMNHSKLKNEVIGNIYECTD